MASHWRTRRRFPPAALDAIEAAVARAERTHAGEVRVIIETGLSARHVIDGVTSRARAADAFAQFGVWDTELNNGVLIYVQMADRAVEIVADRGLDGRVTPAEWESVCRQMEEHFRAGRFQAGAIAGVDAVGTLLARHFPVPDAGPTVGGPTVGGPTVGGPTVAGPKVGGPAGGGRAARRNQLPDRPTLL